MRFVNMKKLFAVVLSVVLVCTMLSALASASDEDEPAASDATLIEGPAETEKAQVQAEEPDKEEPAAEDAQIASDKTDAKSEAKAADPEEKKEEQDDKYPAQTLTTTAGSVKVTLKAPKGSLPKGAKLTARAVGQKYVDAVDKYLEARDKELTDAVAIDVTPLDKDGKEVQPKKPVTVTFSGTNLDMEKDGSVAVYRVSDDAASVTAVPGGGSADAATFTADHFTIYVDGTEETTKEKHETADDAYTLAYGEHVDLYDDDSSSGDSWDISGYTDYVSKSSVPNHSRNRRIRITNINGGTEDQLVLVKHGSQGNRLFYIIAKAPVTKTIKFDGNGEGAEGVPEGTTTIAASYTLPSDKPTRDGYQFDSWNTKSDGSGTKKGAGESYAFADEETEVTFYAQWKKEVTLTYDPNTFDQVTLPYPKEVKCLEGDKEEVDNATRSGYVLKEWKDDDGNTYRPGDELTLPGKNVVLRAQWEEKKISVTYINEGAEFHKDTGIAVSSDYDIYAEQPTHSGENIYVFLGWGPEEAGTAEYWPEQTIETETDDMTLYAIWGNVEEDCKDAYLTANSDEVFYNGMLQYVEDVEDNDVNVDDTTDNRQQGSIRKYGDQGYVKVHGYSVAHGNENNIYAYIDNIYAFGFDAGTYKTPISAPLYYHDNRGFHSLNSYVPVKAGKLVIKPLELTVTTESDSKKYDGTALTKGKGTLVCGDKSYDITGEETTVTITVGEVPDEGAITEDIVIKVDGSQTEVGKSDNTYTIDWNKGTASKRNYKITEKLGTLEVTPDKYTITYDPNGGKFRGSKQPTKVECAADADTTIAKAPVRKGYEFLYWKGSKYQPGDKYTVTADHTFVAQWKKIDPEEKGNSKTSGKTKKHKGVATGDYVRMGFCLFLMAITGVYLVKMSMIFRRRRRPLRR